MTSQSLPVCEQGAQLQGLDGERVRLIGTYLPVRTLKKMTRPGRPRDEVELGAVVIVLEGSASEYDTTAPAGEPVQVALGADGRAAEEIARLRDRRISVEGRLTLSPRAQSSRAASQKPAPVLHDPVELRLAE